MNAADINRAKQIFQIAVELPPVQREAVVTAHCAGNADLRSLVEELLSCDAKGLGDFLCRPVFAPMLEQGEQAADQLPARVGRYEIVRIISEGGMGIVYEARQASPRRRVALKVIRFGLPSRRTLRRFQHEAEVLGQLQHPGIAHIYEAATVEAATPEGVRIRQPFLAMEYIEGKALTDYATQGNLGTRARLELVANVCDAVQHAHLKGVIHRDLKPGNILVDERGQPKILDFGVARATDADTQTVTMQTDIGQLIGTVPYMSPEQVTGDSRQLDTRLDVYSLGVILFELLSGELPYDIRTTSIPEAVRKIRDEEPRRLASISRSLRGDIETIVGKALEKDRERRYQSAAELAADIRHHLRGEPIGAKRHSTLYVLRKTVVRYRGLAIAATLFVVLLGTFAAVSFIQAKRNQRLAVDERRARDDAIEALGLAKREQERADATSIRLQRELTVSNIERGRAFASTGDLTAAEELIWRQHLRNPQSNHSFWALWELYSHNPILAARSADGVTVYAVAFAPDGRTFATAGDDGIVKIWTLDPLQCVSELCGHTDVACGLAFTPDSLELASASFDGMVVIWDLVSQRVKQTMRGDAGRLYAVCYSHDGKQIAVGAESAAIQIWDVESANLIRVLGEHTGAVQYLCLGPDGSLLASGSKDGTVKLWRNLDGPSVATLTGHERSIGAIAFSVDGRILASGGNDRLIKLWDLGTYECLSTFPAANGTLLFLWFTLDGKTLTAGGWWQVDAWDLSTLTRRQLVGHGAIGAVSPDGRFLAAGFWETLKIRASIRVVELGAGDGMLRLGDMSGKGTASVSPDGRLIASGDNAGFVQLWETTTGRPLSRLQSHRSRWSSSHFDPSGQLLATASSDGLVKLWDLTTGNLIASFDGHYAATHHSLSLRPDGRMMASTCLDGMIQIREVPTCRVLASIPATESELLSVRFSPDGERLAAAYRDERIRLFSADGELTADLDLDVCPWTSEFSPDGLKLAVACWGGGQIQIWDLLTNTLELRLTEPKAVVWEVAYLPGNPDILASCSADGTVRLWDLREKRNLLTLAPFNGLDALSVSFTPDGKTLVAAGSDGALYVWDLEYFERHMAGNLHYQMDLLRPELGDAIQEEYLTTWADGVMSRPWPRIGPQAGRVEGTLRRGSPAALPLGRRAQPHRGNSQPYRSRTNAKSHANRPDGADFTGRRRAASP